MSTIVDTYVKTKIKPEHQDIVAMLRALMRASAPNAKEAMSYGIPVWRGNRILAVMSPSKMHITLAFSRGAEFTDRYGLLEGIGKVSKHVKLKGAKDVIEAALTDYIKQALQLDAKKRR